MGTNDKLYVSCFPSVNDSPWRAIRRDQSGNQHVRITDDPHFGLLRLRAPLSPHRVQLLIGKLQCFVTAQLAAHDLSLPVQRRPNLRPASSKLQVPLIREHDSLGLPSSTNHYGFSFGTGFAKPIQHSRKLSPRLASSKNVMRFRRHSRSLANVYTFVYL